MNNVKIMGFTSSIDSVGKTLDLIDSVKDDGEIIQLLNADYIVSKNHVLHGVNQALAAFKRHENIANDLTVEIVLRCSAQRQISKAFKLLGLKEGKMNLCAVLINSKDYTEELSSLFIRDDRVIESYSDDLADLYGITSSEMDNLSLEEVIIDRISRIDIDK